MQVLICPHFLQLAIFGSLIFHIAKTPRNSQTFHLASQRYSSLPSDDSCDILPSCDFSPISQTVSVWPIQHIEKMRTF